MAALVHTAAIALDLITTTGRTTLARWAQSPHPNTPAGISTDDGRARTAMPPSHGGIGLGESGLTPGSGGALAGASVWGPRPWRPCSRGVMPGLGD
jgi:hypothetical protein